MGNKAVEKQEEETVTSQKHDNTLKGKRGFIAQHVGKKEKVYTYVFPLP